MGKGRNGNRKSRQGGSRQRGILARSRVAAVLICLLTTLLYTGCGSADSSYSTVSDSKGTSQSNGAYSAGGGIYEEAAEVAYDMEEGMAADTSSENMGILEGRKLIQTVRLEVETKEFEQMMSTLETQVQDMGGYIESMETYNGSRYSDYISSRYADLTVRVPSGKLDTFLQTVSDISNVVRRYDNVDDVTLSYVDMESRRNTLRTEQERLLEFLEQADTIEDIIALEERLSEVRYQLESMESQLRTLDNLIDYSTIHINISEVKELTVVVEEEPGAGERIVKGFVESLKDIAEGATEIVIWFLTHIPYLIIWAAVIAAVIWGWRKLWKRRMRKKEAKQQEAQARMKRWEFGKQSPEAPKQEETKDQ